MWVLLAGVIILAIIFIVIGSYIDWGNMDYRYKQPWEDGYKEGRITYYRPPKNNLQG